MVAEKGAGTSEPKRMRFDHPARMRADTKRRLQLRRSADVNSTVATAAAHVRGDMVLRRLEIALLRTALEFGYFPRRGSGLQPRVAVLGYPGKDGD